MANSVIRFGTDGWRAEIAKDFTFLNVAICAQAIAEYLRHTETFHRGVVIGFDTRFASADFAKEVAEVLAGNGIKSFLSESAVPTPVISYAVVNREAAAGIVITASHNPGSWNGIKLKSQDGASASTDLVTQVETIVSKTQPASILRKGLKEASCQNLIELCSFEQPYLHRIEQLIDLNPIRKAGLNVAVDSMHGAGGGYFKNLIGDCSTTVTEIKRTANPSFPGMKQPEPIGQNLKELRQLVCESKATIGLATDGDADRLGVIDEQGNYITPLQVYTLLAFYFLEIRRERGAIVRTITSTNMLNLLANKYQVPVIETPVGFKYIAPVMSAQNALIGGEESGGYGFRGHVPERDGLLSGLYLLDLMARTKKPLSQLITDLNNNFGTHCYDRADHSFLEENRSLIMERLKQTQPKTINDTLVLRKETIDGFRFIMEDNSWLLIRFSGTEPLLRIYAEGNSTQQVQSLLAKGLSFTGIKEQNEPN